MMRTLLWFAASVAAYLVVNERHRWIRRFFLGMMFVSGISVIYAVAKGFVYGDILAQLW